MMILTRETASGFQMGKWVNWLAESLLRVGRGNGFVFPNSRGKQAKIGSYKDQFLDQIASLCARKGILFAPGVNVVKVYSLKRLLSRRGSMSKAVNKQEVPQSIINQNNRQRHFEAAKERRPLRSIMVHYKKNKAFHPNTLEVLGIFLSMCNTNNQKLWVLEWRQMARHLGVSEGRRGNVEGSVFEENWM
jgi:hypothetical protein